MAIDQRRTMLYLVLVASSTVTIYSTYSRWASAPAPAAAPAATVAPADETVATTAAPEPAAEPAVPLAGTEYTAWRASLAGERRDPFFTVAEIEAMNRPDAPVVPAPEPVRQGYTLKFVLFAGTEGRALIDDTVVKVGDTLGDERVVEIRRSSVVLERAGTRRRIDVASASNAVNIQMERP